MRFNAHSTDHGSGRQPYTGRAEIVAVHVPDPEALFMVPVEVCPRFTGYLRLDPPKNNQRRGVTFAADYRFESWVRDLFDGLD